ncbi:hypothetical protein [Oleiharenicola lentus]|uniref:hypothetical protein n=1 Tax=Oleiharenicola lentus TaxID=2508720 RepID=UPI003F66F28B
MKSLLKITYHARIPRAKFLAVALLVFLSAFLAVPKGKSAITVLNSTTWGDPTRVGAIESIDWAGPYIPDLTSALEIYGYGSAVIPADSPSSQYFVFVGGPDTIHFVTVEDGGTINIVGVTTEELPVVTVTAPSASTQNIFAVTGACLALGITSSGAIFASRYLWRLFQRLLGAPTWSE